MDAIEKVFWVISGLTFSLLIGGIAETAGKSQCKRANNAKDCVAVYVPVKEANVRSSGGEDANVP